MIWKNSCGLSKTSRIILNPMPEKLLGKYKDEVIEIYEQYIFISAQQSSNRHRYREVCKKIKKFEKTLPARKKQGNH